MKGVVSGVRDYGNRMGIPTVNGAVYFDPRYLGNPLVYCGNVGLMPRDKSHKQPRSRRLDRGHRRPHRPRRNSRGHVQFGGIDQRKRNALRRCRADRQRDHREDGAGCAAGGARPSVCTAPSPTAGPVAFPAPWAKWEKRLGPKSGWTEHRLKYDGLSYTEIWISEAQERMVLSVPPGELGRFPAAVRSRKGSKPPIIGEFVPTGRLQLKYHGHGGRRSGHGVPARWSPARRARGRRTTPPPCHPRWPCGASTTDYTA